MDNSQESPTLLDLMRTTSRSDADRRSVKRLKTENSDRSKQGVLFIGANDEPGQNYLFGTKGFHYGQ